MTWARELHAYLFGTVLIVGLPAVILVSRLIAG